MIYFHYEHIDFRLENESATTNWLVRTAAKYGKKIGSIHYIFCTDEHILEINRTYLSHDYYTDIITFDDGVEGSISGDIFISVDTVRSNAAQFGTDFMDEIARVMVHGVLHLCGQDDHTDAERAMMRQKEDEALSRR